MFDDLITQSRACNACSWEDDAKIRFPRPSRDADMAIQDDRFRRLVRTETMKQYRIETGNENDPFIISVVNNNKF